MKKLVLVFFALIVLSIQSCREQEENFTANEIETLQKIKSDSILVKSSDNNGSALDTEGDPVQIGPRR